MRTVYGADVGTDGRVLLRLWDDERVVYRHFQGNERKAQACADSVNDLYDPVLVWVDGVPLVVERATEEVA